mmetsp:Transcript_12886/g.30935  ORF Transcript_12886/g.30935 Transcript_12886/m.30935 type:complete len:237 (+) Transcript_12886:377-1087(+)
MVCRRRPRRLGLKWATPAYRLTVQQHRTPCLPKRLRPVEVTVGLLTMWSRLARRSTLLAWKKRRRRFLDQLQKRLLHRPQSPLPWIRRMWLPPTSSSSSGPATTLSGADAQYRASPSGLPVHATRARMESGVADVACCARVETTGRAASRRPRQRPPRPQPMTSTPCPWKSSSRRPILPQPLLYRPLRTSRPAPTCSTWCTKRPARCRPSTPRRCTRQEEERRARRPTAPPRRQLL